MGQPSLRLDGDWYGLTRSMYAEGGDWHAWGEGIIERCLALLPHPIVGLSTVEYASDARVRMVDLIANSDVVRQAFATHFFPMAHRMDRATVRAFYFPPRNVVQLRGVLATMPPTFRSDYRGALDFLGVSDGFAVTMHPEPGVAMTLFALTREAVRLSPAERGLMTRLGLHLESSVRLRRRPESVVAILGASGRIEYLRDPAERPDRYRTAAASLRVARRGSGDALALWRGLIGGELSIVERGEGPRSKTYFFENPPHRQPLRALTSGEQDVVSMVCQGHTAKAIAYGLGLSEGAVSMRLQSAAGKVGLASRIELVRLAAMLTRDPRARFTETALTTAERDVLFLLAQGLTNGEIAKARGRSVQTIANQVSALLSKTGAANRKVLAARSG